jgi:hypothetical protein
MEWEWEWDSVLEDILTLMDLEIHIMAMEVAYTVIIMADTTLVTTEVIIQVIMAVITVVTMEASIAGLDTDIQDITFITRIRLMDGMRGQVQCHQGGTIVLEAQAQEEEIHIFQVPTQEPAAVHQVLNMHPVREELLQAA